MFLRWLKSVFWIWGIFKGTCFEGLFSGWPFVVLSWYLKERRDRDDQGIFEIRVFNPKTGTDA